MHRPILSFRRASRLRRALPLTAGLALALPLGAGALAAPAASAATTTCLVVDASSDHSYTSLQDAVNAPATSPGDTLFVKGTCTGVTDVTKSLTITGQSNGGQKTATLNGGNLGGASTGVLTVEPGVTVTLNSLTITNGNSGSGGGIINDQGTVILNGSTITGNTGCDGGGVYNYRGALTLNDSTITDNTACDGGGIYNIEGTVTLAGSSTITGNTAPDPFFGGGILTACGTLVNVIAAPAPGANVYNNQPDEIADVSGPGFCL